VLAVAMVLLEAQTLVYLLALPIQAVAVVVHIWLLAMVELV
jgi:hypothetical protein